MNENFTPLDMGPKLVELFKCNGRVISIRDFLVDNLDILSTLEKNFLKENLHLLSGPDKIPENFRICLSRSRDIASDLNPVLTAHRSGARSAFMPEASLQLKGCRPVLNGEEFPTEYLPLGSTEIVRDRIPFGVMTAEAVLREILGFCFMQKRDLPIQAIPLGVTAFRYKNKSMGFGMLLKLKSENRVETHLEVPHGTVRDLITAQTNILLSMPDFVVGSELRLRGISLWKYIEAKGRIIAVMNWHGGFRGILNSNFGNDVLISERHDKNKLALADFDTFEMLSAPTDSSNNSLDPFVLRCLLEIVMGSLPIMQYANLANQDSEDKASDVLGAIYFRKSSLWRSYYRHFLSEAIAKGFSSTAIGESIDRMRRTKAFTEMLMCRILNDKAIKRIKSERPFYYPHN